MIVIKDKYKTDIVCIRNLIPYCDILPSNYLFLHTKRLKALIKKYKKLGWDDSWDKRELQIVDNKLKW